MSTSIKTMQLEEAATIKEAVLMQDSETLFRLATSYAERDPEHAAHLKQLAQNAEYEDDGVDEHEREVERAEEQYAPAEGF